MIWHLLSGGQFSTIIKAIKTDISFDSTISLIEIDSKETV